jgi:hypothetical protein
MGFKTILIGLCIVFTTSSAFAKNLIEVQIEGQPLIYVSGGKTNRCGLRAFGGVQSATDSSVRWFDISLNVYRNGGALIEALAYDVVLKHLQAGKPPKNAQVQAAWFKTLGEDATVPIPGSQQPTDGIGVIMYVATMDSVFAGIIASIKGESILVGLQRRGEKTERVYSGKIGISEGERKRLIVEVQT